MVGQYFLQCMRLWFRIMTHHIEVLHQMHLQFRKISPAIDIGTEIHLNLLAISKGVVTMSVYHTFLIIPDYPNGQCLCVEGDTIALDETAESTLLGQLPW